MPLDEALIIGEALLQTFIEAVCLFTASLDHVVKTRERFGPDVGCLARYGLTAAKAHVLLSRLGQLNAVLAQGAQVFGFGVADPPFAGHQLCSADPYVQGPGDPAPRHPTAAGELAIALADQQALPAAENLVPAPSASPAAGTD